MNYLTYAGLTFHSLALLHHGSLAMYVGVKYFLPNTDPLLVEIIETAPLLFTVWTMVFQSTYLGIAIFDDVLSLSESRLKPLEDVRNYFFNTLLVPYSLFTTIAFWTIHCVLKDHVVPNEIAIPLWLNHMVHTSPAIILLIEFLIYKHTSPDKRFAVVGLGVVLFVYDCMFVLGCLLREKHFYRIQHRLGLHGSIVFVVFASVCVFGCMQIGFYLQKLKAIHLTRCSTKIKRN